jgi:hypothetical protein
VQAAALHYAAIGPPIMMRDGAQLFCDKHPDK